MNRYPLWKYALLAVALLVGLLYALFPALKELYPDPARQHRTTGNTNAPMRHWHHPRMTRPRPATTRSPDEHRDG